jgi:hypothetical protein
MTRCHPNRAADNVPPSDADPERSLTKALAMTSGSILSGKISDCPGVLARGMSNPFRYFNSSPEVIRPVVIMYVRYPLSLRNVEDL